MSSAPDISDPKQDRLAVISFTFAVLIMIVPTEAGILVPVFRRGGLIAASLVAAFFFLIVFTPFILAVRRRRRESFARRGRGFLIATGVILVLNLLWFGSVVIYQLYR